MSQAIDQEIELGAKPDRVYRALLDGKQFSSLSGGAPAEIQAAPGGAYQCFGGQILGRIIELVPDRRIVLAWRVGMWGEGEYSVVRIDLGAKGTGSLLRLNHRGFPEEHREHLEAGWHRMYWDPLKKHLGS